MGPWIPLDAIYTAAPQDAEPDGNDWLPEADEMFGEPGDGTLGPGLEPETFDAAILAGLVTP